MKTTILLLVVLASGIIFTSEIMHSDSSPGGYTGSPLDGKTCTRCHAGTAIAQDSMITSNIPESGYVPGQTYTITVQLDYSSMNRCGFELTSETHFDKVGTFKTIDGQGTQLLNFGRAITHSYLGNTPKDGSKTWKVDWVAPAKSTGQVTFYAAFNAANGDGSSRGDQIITSNLQVQEAQVTGIEEQRNQAFSVYYNSNSHTIRILNMPKPDTKASAQIFSMNGTPVKSFPNVNNNATLSVSDLSSGIYIITIFQDSHVYTQKIAVN